MIFAGKRRVLELQNDLVTLKNAFHGLQLRIEQLEDGWDQQVLKLSNAKELMSRASARLERAAARATPSDEAPAESTHGDNGQKPAELTNPFAARMLGMKG